MTATGRLVPPRDRGRAGAPPRSAHRAHLRRVFDALDQPTLLVSVETDRRYVIAAANARAEALMERAEHELVGRTVEEVSPLDDVETIRAQYDAVVTTGTDATREHTFEIGDERHDLRVTLRPIFDGDRCTHVLAIIADISAVRAAEERARSMEDRFEALVQQSSDITLVFDENGVLEYISPSVERWLGYTPDEMRGVNIFDFVHPDDVEVAIAGVADFAASGERQTPPESGVPVRVRRKDGGWRMVEGTTTDLREHPAVRGFVANIRDVTERNVAVEALRQSEARFSSLAASAPIGITLADATGKITYTNERFKDIFRDAWSEMQDWQAVVHPEDRAGVRQAAIAAQHSGREFSHTYRILLPSGDVRWLHVRSRALHDRDTTYEGSVGVVEDVTERKEFEARLAHQATHDPLTGLPNRILFEDRLEQALARGQRTGAGTAVLFLDLDLFKLANDRYGHAVGDHLLAEVAERLRVCVRGGDTVARIGGDEFATVCEGADVVEAEAIADRILAASTEPFDVSGTDVYLTASIGIAITDTESDVQTLMRHADAAMYRAKQGGRGRAVHYDPSLERETSRLELAGALRRAIELDELRVHYQPILDVATQELLHLEALVRWQHPTRGLLLPAEFIGIAEDTGLITPLGAWVLEQSCRQLATWKQKGHAVQNVRVSVNVSAHQLDQTDFVAVVDRILRESGLDAHALQLEITESVLVRDPVGTLSKLEELESMGVRLAVDDFGTGYASLMQLKRLPIHVIKIDRSFVMGLGQDSEDEAIVSATIRMAHELGILVTAEGVETAEQLERLRSLGCDDAQGFLFSPARPADEALGS